MTTKPNKPPVFRVDLGAGHALRWACHDCTPGKVCPVHRPNYDRFGGGVVRREKL